MNWLEFLRQFRIGPFAIFDFAISYLGFYLLSPYIIKFLKIFGISTNTTNIMWLVLPISIIAHIIFSPETPLTKMFLNPNDYYLLKIVIIWMVYIGLKS